VSADDRKWFYIYAFSATAACVSLGFVAGVALAAGWHWLLVAGAATNAVAWIFFEARRIWRTVEHSYDIGYATAVRHAREERARLRNRRKPPALVVVEGGQAVTCTVGPSVLSYVTGTKPVRRCACAKCSPAWRAHVLLHVSPRDALHPRYTRRGELVDVEAELRERAAPFAARKRRRS
jgi:hypothetical protein